jgi:hypothetical protein
VSNDHWIKGQEISYLPAQRKVNNGVALMSNSKLSAFIDDPHQKFYYTYNFDRPFDFHIELIKILLNDEPGKTYPYVFRSAGEPPRMAGTSLVPLTEVVSEEFDFLNEMNYNTSDPEELSSMSEMGITDDGQEVEDEESEEDEFSSENYGEDDPQKEEDY